MLSDSIYDIEFSKFSNFQKQFNAVSRYLINNINVYLDDDIKNDISNTRFSMDSPMSVIFENLRDNSDYYNKIAFIDVSLSKDSVPGILAIPSIIVDVRQFEDASSLNSLSAFKDKVILNLSHILKLSKDPMRDTGKYIISDINELHSYCVRAALVMSYFDRKTQWLSPFLCKFIAQSYSMAISSLISKPYNLTYPDQMQVAGILSMYAMQQLSAENTEINDMPLLSQCTYAGSVKNLQGLAELVHDFTNGNKLTITSTCDAIAEFGLDRLKTFNIAVMRQITTKIALDHITSCIAIEYMPYWAHQIILSVSGVKSGLYFQLKNNNMMQDVTKFVYELNTSKYFLKNVLR